MRVRFIAQPYSDESDLAGFLAEMADNPKVESIDIVVAWAKRSGFNQIADALKRFTARNGRLRMIVGISQGGATRQGLALTLEIATEAYVFHNPSGRTFHPKLYIGNGPEVSYITVGSQNLTRGGMVENYELGALIEAHPNDHLDDRQLVNSANGFVHRLLDDHELCIRLTVDSLAAICANPLNQIGDEERSAAGSTSVERAESGSEKGSARTTAGIFGRSATELKHGRRSGETSTSVDASRESSTNDSTSGAHAAHTGKNTAVSPTVSRRWFKKIFKADAQRLGGNSHPTGHVTLTQSSHPIDPTLYFRRDFFGNEAWKAVPGRPGREQVSLTFSVNAGGMDKGSHTLVIDHNPSFESGQGNRSTTLRWGDALGQYLRNDVNHVGDFLTLEALPDGSYRLIIASIPSGDFV